MEKTLIILIWILKHRSLLKQHFFKNFENNLREDSQVYVKYNGETILQSETG